MEKDLDKPELVLLGSIDNADKLVGPEITLTLKDKKHLNSYPITSSVQAMDFLKSVFPKDTIGLNERFYVLYLDRSNRIVGYYNVSIGGIAGVNVDPRLVFAPAIKMACSGMILCHNHPSGNTQPSEADIALTNKIKEGCKYFDLMVLDHIIITESDFYSFADNGKLSGIEKTSRNYRYEPREKFLEWLEDEFKNGSNITRTILENKAKQFGINDKTEVKEYTELAIYHFARSVASDSRIDEDTQFEKLVEFYNTQARLSLRTSESVMLQQYSTPVPIGFLAGLFCNLKKKGKYFEPSAGNGLLTFVCDPSNMVVNEIDSLRLSNLRTIPYKQVISQDAGKPFVLQPKEFDGVITNPPFGSLDDKVSYKGIILSSLDHVMAIYALETMKDQGRAAIIIGGHTKWDEQGRIQSGKNLIFFNYLYKHFHVSDVINMDGDFFSKQGTSFPTRLILINGRKKYPSGNAPLKTAKDKTVKTFDQLLERVKLAISNSKEIPVEQEPDSSVQHFKHYMKLKEMYKKRIGILLLSTDNGYAAYGLDALALSRVLERPTDSISITPATTNLAMYIHKDEVRYVLGKLEANESKYWIVDELSPMKKETLIEKLRRKSVDLKKKLDQLDLDSGELGAPYLPASTACTVLDTVVPDAMSYETQQVLESIRNAVGGSMDEFVRDRLQYPSSVDLCKALSAEQTDAVAIAIYNIEAKGQGMIIGDQTGIGKGRIAAAVIRYAVKHGMRPIFITEKPNLFSDLYRDLVAIGSDKLTPFILNSRDAKTDIKDEDGEIIHKAVTSAEQDAIVESYVLPDKYDFIVSTYSQFNSVKTRADKPNFIYHLAKDNILVLDESHNSSGSSNTGEYMRKLVQRAKGVVFLSATFAKRPDNLPVYAMKTAISEANLTTESLIKAIRRGGVALQEVLSSQLVAEGQMIRRERSFEGVEVNYKYLDGHAERDIAISDGITRILRGIIQLQEHFINHMVIDLDRELAPEGERVITRGGTEVAGIDNINYFSKIFMVINQMLFSLKAEAVADRAIERLKEGKKPVIAFSSTMGSFIETLTGPEGLPIQDGDEIRTDFSEVLKKGIESVMKYTITTANGDKEFKQFEPKDLSVQGMDAYLSLLSRIQKHASGIMLSPIDLIKDKIRKAGYSVAEVTGRKYELRLNREKGTGIVKARKKVNTNDAFRQFNNNEVDVLMINQSGSTGASAHAIVTPKVPASQVKQRVMIILQAELDINTEVQKRGRINRTGQLFKPIYDYIISSIPAEKRIMMMLQQKLKSLDANTASNQKQSSKMLDVADFLNKYGDKVVTDYMRENKELNLALGDPLHLILPDPVQLETEDEQTNDYVKQLIELRKMEAEDKERTVSDAAHRVSGRVAVLPVDAQQKFYKDITKRYNDYIEYLKQNDAYDLEVETMDLKAKKIASRLVKAGKGGQSSFGEDTYLERVEVDILKKPFLGDELVSKIKERLGGKNEDAVSKELLEDFERYVQAKRIRDIENENKYYDERKAGLEKNPKLLAIKESQGSGAYQDALIDKAQELEKDRKRTLEMLESSFTHRREYMRELIEFFYPGRKISFLYEGLELEDAMFTPAVCLGILIDMEDDNRWLPGQVKVAIAVANSIRYLTIPASAKDHLQKIMLASKSLRQYSSEAELKQYWLEQTRLTARFREERYIVTGNLLQAFADYKGKLVSYTTNEGEVKKGILLPQRFEEESTTSTVEVPVSRAIPLVMRMSSGDQFNLSENISIQNTANGFKMITPLSKTKGGKYFLDNEIKALTSTGKFESSSNKMVAVIPEDNIPALLELLQSKFNTSIRLTIPQYSSIGDQGHAPMVTKIWKPLALLNLPIKVNNDRDRKIKILRLRAKALTLKLKLLKI